MATAVTFFQTV